jgi:hypothetical protein
MFITSRSGEKENTNAKERRKEVRKKMKKDREGTRRNNR